ncbi:MAG: carboxypeptidase M32 [Verrucomicrobiota bacterium]
MTSYQNLRTRFRDAALLRSTESVLGWDQETGLPSKAVDWRAEQMSYLSGQVHRLTTAPEVGDLLAECEQAGFNPQSAEGVNVRGWRRDYDREAKLPAALVEEFSLTTSQGMHAWAAARKASDFASFQPVLEKLVRLCQEKADHLGWTTCRYDALMDMYEPGARSADIAALFAKLGPDVSALIGPAMEAAKATPEGLLAGHYPIAAQQAFNREVAEAVGFDFEAGRIDTTTHPFCTSLGPGDIRLTTRYDEGDFLSSLYGVLHEAGHGLYEQGLNPAEWGLPAGEAVSLGIHESQSRLWENHIGGSVAFWAHWHPRACHHFPELKRFTPEQVAAAARHVAPSFIRVEADEVTYDLHIILRFELERALINGDLAVKDVPEAWNARFRELLGLTVPGDAQGCLQDIHWSMGSLGYFATYTLGNLNAAQLMRAAKRDLPSLENELASGQYASLLTWLRAKIHSPGRTHDPQDLMRLATGETTQAHYHLEHLRAKFL